MCKHTSIDKGLKCTDDGYCPICLHAELEEIVKTLGCHPAMLMNELRSVIELSQTRPSADDYRMLEDKFASERRALELACDKVREYERSPLNDRFAIVEFEDYFRKKAREK